MNSAGVLFVRTFVKLLLFWIVIYFVNFLLLRFQKTKRSYRTFLRWLGCHISLCNVGFYTTSFNRTFHRIGTSNVRLWRLWFTFGIIVALFTSFVGCSALFLLPIKYILEIEKRPSSKFEQNPRGLEISTNPSTNTENERETFIIQPIIPGINVPWEQIPHFFFALLLCTVFHEFGHAIAAASEQIRVNGCGYFVFLLYPGAYVDLHQEQLQMISAIRQLRIYCAGVFHNIVLVVIAVIYLLFNPILLRHFYTEAAIVSNVAKNSPVRDLLPVHSIIRSIDGCQVNTSAEWFQCLKTIHHRDPQMSNGYCLTQNEIQLHSSHIKLNQTNQHDCCQNLSQRNYCFLYFSKQNLGQNGACLEARLVTKHPNCLLNSDCQFYSSDASCVRPFSGDNITRLIPILHSNGPPILFVGSVAELYRTVGIQSYKPNYIYFPTIIVHDVPLFFQYVAAFSFALAVFNAVPCYALDGQYILSSFVEYVSPISLRRRRPCILLGLIFGTCLLVTNITLAFVRYFV